MQIYVCEDHLGQMERIQKAIDNTILIESLDMTIALCTHDPYEILKKVQENEGSQNIYFLDVNLGTDMSGIKLGEIIRTTDPKGFIVYITSHSEMSQLTFQYRLEALDYIVKDDFDQVTSRIRDCLLCIQDRLMSASNQNTESFKIENKEQIVFLPYKDILLFETSLKAHKVMVYTHMRQIEFYGSMNDIEKKLDERFIRCHKSYIVNSNKIARIDKKNKMVELVNGQTCLLSIRGLRHLARMD